jgi:hypothetical protein
MPHARQTNGAGRTARRLTPPPFTQTRTPRAAPRNAAPYAFFAARTRNRKTEHSASGPSLAVYLVEQADAPPPNYRTFDTAVRAACPSAVKNVR